jgi:hypothetical protein
MSRSKRRAGQTACERLSPIYHLLSSKTRARVVEWQTRTFEGRMPKGMRVQVPPRAPNLSGRLKEFSAHLSRFNPLKKNDLVKSPSFYKKSTNPGLWRHPIPYRCHASQREESGRQTEAPRKWETEARSVRCVGERSTRGIPSARNPSSTASVRPANGYRTVTRDRPRHFVNSTRIAFCTCNRFSA